MLLRFRASTDKRYFFDQGKGNESLSETRLARWENDEISLSTGQLEARIGNQGNRLFEQVLLSGRDQFGSHSPSNILILDGVNASPCHFTEHKVELEENTSKRVVAK